MSAQTLEMRSNVVSYAGAENVGSALYVLDATQLQGFTSDNNWFSAVDPAGKHLVWNGSRVTLSRWRRTARTATAASPRLPA